MEFVLIVIALFVVMTVLAAGAEQSGNPPKPSPILTQSRPIGYPTVEQIQAIHDEIYNRKLKTAKIIADKARPILLSKLHRGETYFVFGDIFKERSCCQPEELELAANILRQELEDKGLGKTVSISSPSYGCYDL